MPTDGPSFRHARISSSVSVHFISGSHTNLFYRPYIDIYIWNIHKLYHIEIFKYQIDTQKKLQLLNVSTFVFISNSSFDYGKRMSAWTMVGLKRLLGRTIVGLDDCWVGWLDGSTVAKA